MNLNREQMLLYAITDRSWLREGETLESVVETLLEQGVTLVQLREKEASHDQLVEMARSLLPLCHRYGVPLIVNDDVQAALESGADGVHVGQSDLEVTQARAILGPDKLIGTSAHNVAEALAAQAAGADYLGSGAVFGSHTKRDVNTLGLDALEAICRSVDLPVVAIGGITRDNLPQLQGRGIAGVALISALFAPADKETNTRVLVDLARKAVQTPLA